MEKSLSEISPEVLWVALCLVPRIGGRTLSSLLEAYGSPKAILEASHASLEEVPRIGPKTIEAIGQIDLAEVERQIEGWYEDGITLLTWQDALYPEPLLALHDRPPLLFARGQLAQNWERVISIVGTREPSVESVTLAETMACELGRRGWLVASGLARGIDAAAHRGALKIGSTVAYLGSGISNIQPPSNRGLARRIMEIGAIYSEVSPEFIPTPASLMARNRLISGSAKATVVIQAEAQCGSMEAARKAWRQQRTVFTVDADFAGNRELLRMEALPIAPKGLHWDEFAEQLENLPDVPRQLSFFD